MKIATFSFDDGGRGDFPLVETLRENSCPATFYLVSGLLLESVYEVYAPSEIKELYRDFEIGAHSVSHCNFNAFPVPRVKNEVYQSKHDVDAFIGYNTSLFAYPYGRSSHVHREIVASLFKYARGTQRVPNVSSGQFYQGPDKFDMPITGYLLPKEEHLFDSALSFGVPIHIVGHGWQFVKHDLKELLVSWIKQLKDSEYKILENSRFFDMVTNGPNT